MCIKVYQLVSERFEHQKLGFLGLNKSEFVMMDKGDQITKYTVSVLFHLLEH